MRGTEGQAAPGPPSARHARWHELLDQVLDSGDRDQIQIIQQQLQICARMLAAAAPPAAKPQQKKAGSGMRLFILTIFGVACFGQGELMTLPNGHLGKLRYQANVDRRGNQIVLDMIGSSDCEFPEITLRFSIEAQGRDKRKENAQFTYRVEAVSRILAKRWLVQMPSELRGMTVTRLGVEGISGRYSCMVNRSLQAQREPLRIDVPAIGLRPALAPGARGVLTAPAALAATQAARDRYLKAAELGDEYGLREMIALGDLVRADRGTEVLVLNVDRTFADLMRQTQELDLVTQGLDYQRCAAPLFREGSLELPEGGGSACPLPRLSERYVQALELGERLVLVEVRILSGPDAGRKGWTTANLIEPGVPGLGPTIEQ